LGVLVVVVGGGGGVLGVGGGGRGGEEEGKWKEGRVEKGVTACVFVRRGGGCKEGRWRCWHKGGGWEEGMEC